MIDERDQFDRAVRQFPPPEGSFNRLRKRRDRKRRNHRLGAGLVAVVITVASLSVLTRMVHGGTQPATQIPTPTASQTPTQALSNHPTIIGLDAALQRVISNIPAYASELDLSGDGTTVAFGTTRGRIGTVSLDGGEIHYLTGLGGKEFNPAWSPDGSRIAFDEYGQHRGIFVMDANGSNARMLTPSGSLPRWSPDGASLVFEGGNGIYRVPSQGGSPVYLANGRSPDWSPDGTRIAFIWWNTERSGVAITSADGTGHVQRLPDLSHASGNYNPAWSPDGSKIAWVVYCRGGGATGIEAIDVATERSAGFIRPCGYYRFGYDRPSWLPSGDALLVNH